MHDKKECAFNIRYIKQALNHGLILKKSHRVIKCIQKTWLKPYTDMSAALSKKAKNDIKKDFLKLMGNPVLAKLWKM